MKIGVLGAGQLGRMLALAGYPLGHTFRFFDTVPDAPASHLAPCIASSYSDHDALESFAGGLDVVTYEFENVPVEASRFLAERVPVSPPPEALEVSQDRFIEKQFFTSLNIPTPAFADVARLDDLNKAVARIGAPCILKTRRFGYDGKGQSVIRSADDGEKAWGDVAGAPSILEQMIPFEYEVSILAARGAAGWRTFYPLVRNVHAGGILRLSHFPVHEPALQALAEEYAARVLEELSYVGVLALEFFVVDGKLLINEMAPRVHNSGHLTIEGSETSQFENHIRAISGMPPGSTAPRGFSAMVNLIGEIPDVSAVLQIGGAHLHLYGKEPRPNRKLGHITVLSHEKRILSQKLAKIAENLPLSETSRIISQSNSAVIS